MPPTRSVLATPRAAVRVLLPILLPFVAACSDPLRVSSADRRAISDSLSAMVSAAYDFAQPDSLVEPTARLLSLYPDTGRVISAAAGRVTTTRQALGAEIAGFWQRVGRNMQNPRFVVGSTYVDIITRDAAVMTLRYSIPHTTPQGTPHTVSGAWTMLWRRDNGRWRIVQEHLSDTPESTAPGPTPPDTMSAHQH